MLVTAAAAVALLATAANAQSTVNLLAADRAAGRFSVGIPYNAEQRDAYLTQIETLLGKVWVNYESKLLNYGSAADPFPVIQDLRKNIATVSDMDLQLKTIDAFVSVRDLHTRFFSSGPQRCFSATSGVFFELIESADIAKAPRIVVLNKDARAPITNLLGADFAKITIGDDLVSINGDSFVQWFEKNQFKSGGGANTFGGHRRAIDFLNVVPGSINRLPADDTITFVFKSRATGQNYTTVLNYVAVRNDVCWNLNNKLYKEITGKDLPGTPPPPPPASASAKGDKEAAVLEGAVVGSPVEPATYGYDKRPMDMIESPALDFKKEALGTATELGPVTLNPTATTGLSWGIWDPKGKNLGVLRLDDFSPPNGDDAALLIIRGLLNNELKDTNAVVIDIRNNGGGSITYSTAIPQLFQADFLPYGARYLYNEVMKGVFVDNAAPGDPWAEAYRKTKPGSKYTELALFDTFERLNQLGQAYLKPVGVLNNGRCYSACDRLSACIQGSGTGIVFGEDGASGAGGANVIQHTQLMTLNPSVFKAFPFTANMTQGASNFANRMSSGVRQSIRNGLQAGRLVEDIGIATDVVVRARLEDILPGSTTSSQYDRIGDYLIAEGVRTGKAGLGFTLEPLQLDLPLGKVRLAPQTAGLDEIIVQTSTGKRLGRRVDLFAGIGAPNRAFPIEFVPDVTGFAKSQVVVVGKKAGKQFLKTNRYVRIVPKDADRADATKGFNWNFETSPSTVLYNAAASLADPKLGWNKVADGIQIGNGKQYVDNVDSSYDFFLKAPVGTKLSVKIAATYDTELDFDYLQLNYVDNKGKLTPIVKSTTAAGAPAVGVSGQGSLDFGKVYEVVTTTETFSLTLRFTSDSGVTGGLVKVTGFSVSA